MAVAFDQFVSSTSVGSTTVNIGPVTPTGTDRLLIGFIGTGLTGAGPDMTDLNHDAIGTGTEKWDSGDFTPYLRNHAWFILNPNTNSSNVTYTLSAAPDHGAAVATLFTGVDQTTPMDTEVVKNATDDDPTVTITTGETGDAVVDFFVGDASGAGVITLTGDGVLIVEFEDISSYTTVSCARADGAASVTRSYTWVDGEYWLAAVNINQAVTGDISAATTLLFGHTADLKAKGKLDAATTLAFSSVASLTDATPPSNPPGPTWKKRAAAVSLLKPWMPVDNWPEA